LREGDGPRGSVPVNLEAKKLSSGSKVPEPEVSGELLDEGLDGRIGLGDDGHVINKDRDDEVVPEEDVSLGYKSCLEALHRPIYVPLDLEDLLGVHYLFARGKVDNLPSPISGVSLKLLRASLPPLDRFRTFLGFLEGSWFSDGG
jgi:hypothetical protein